jgi:hypothetical protein
MLSVVAEGFLCGVGSDDGWIRIRGERKEVEKRARPTRSATVEVS